jgi:hypothetical protein
MPQVAFKPTIPVFERANIVHALDSAATVIGNRINKIISFYWFLIQVDALKDVSNNIIWQVYVKFINYSEKGIKEAQLSCLELKTHTTTERIFNA